MIDDFYKKVVPDKVKFRRNVDMALLSDSEIIMISLCGELLGIVSENAWFNPSTFFGYKVHVLTTESGTIKLFEILSATRATFRKS